MHYKVVFWVAQTTSGKQKYQAMRATALKKYDRHRLTKGECKESANHHRDNQRRTGGNRRGHDSEEEQGIEDGVKAGEARSLKETWKPRVCLPRF